MGRGLRVPNIWNFSSHGNPVVRIFNHSSWANRVLELVNEVLEIDKKIVSRIIKESQYNFSLLNINYDMSRIEKETIKEDKYDFFKKGIISLPTISDNTEVTTVFSDVVNQRITGEIKTKIIHKTYTIEEIAQTLYERFDDLDDQKMSAQYKKEWTIEKLCKIIKDSLDDSGNNVITDLLKQRILSAFGTLFRTANKTVVFQKKPNNFFLVETSNKEIFGSISAYRLKKEYPIYFTTESIKVYTELEDLDFISEIRDTANGYKHKIIHNINNYKTPLSIIIVDSDNERKLVDAFLTNPAYTGKIDKWIKSSSQGFYSIDYSWRKGNHPKRGAFNPDFFIIVKDMIIILEVKDDSQINEPDEENIGKYKSAIEHFDYINENLIAQGKKTIYKFSMITPESFKALFDLILEDYKKVLKFKSLLDIKIDESL